MSERDRDMNERVLRAYRRLLELRVPFRSVATRPLRRLVTKRRQAGDTMPSLDMRNVSLERLASITALLDADPELIAELLQPKAIPCPNASCPRFTADAWLFREVESHCSICGSRFRGQRLLSTYDLNHGQSLPSPERVRRARRRLASWRHHLRRACAEIAQEGREIHITEAFQRAGVPMNANLRASRLGLTAIVRSAEAKRVSAIGPWRFVLRGCVRRAATKPDLPWLGRWLFTQAYTDLPKALQEPVRERKSTWYCSPRD